MQVAPPPRHRKPRSPQFRHGDRGVTLLELAIVLGVIALIAGGLLAVVNLRETASGQALISEYTSFISAIDKFRTRYEGQKPGDLNNPEDYFLTPAARVAGNGNGVIESEARDGQPAEATVMFPQLHEGGFLSGNFSGEDAASDTGIVTGTNRPSSRVTGVGWNFVNELDPNWSWDPNKRFRDVWQARGGVGQEDNAVSVSVLRYMDQKVDGGDGPIVGRLIVTSDPTATSSPVAVDGTVVAWNTASNATGIPNFVQSEQGADDATAESDPDNNSSNSSGQNGHGTSSGSNGGTLSASSGSGNVGGESSTSSGSGISSAGGTSANSGAGNSSTSTSGGDGSSSGNTTSSGGSGGRNSSGGSSGNGSSGGSSGQANDSNGGAGNGGNSGAGNNSASSGGSSGGNSDDNARDASGGQGNGKNAEECSSSGCAEQCPSGRNEVGSACTPTGKGAGGTKFEDCGGRKRCCDYTNNKIVADANCANVCESLFGGLPECLVGSNLCQCSAGTVCASVPCSGVAGTRHVCLSPDVVCNLEQSGAGAAGTCAEAKSTAKERDGMCCSGGQQTACPCPGGQVRDRATGKCNCPTGAELWWGGVCQPCPANSDWDADEKICICVENSYLDPTKGCVLCTGGETVRPGGGGCECVSDAPQNARCFPRDTCNKCVPPFGCVETVAGGGLAFCGCPKGQRLVQGNVCGECSFDHNCSAGTICEGNKCVCPPAANGSPCGHGCGCGDRDLECVLNGPRGVCQPKCTGGKVRNAAGACVCTGVRNYDNNGNCDCPPEYPYFKNGECIRCLGGSEWDGLACVCTQGRVWTGQACECGQGKIWDGAAKQCLCPANTSWNGVLCVPIPNCLPCVECERVNGVCVCGTQTGTPGVPPGGANTNGSCTCAVGYGFNPTAKMCQPAPTGCAGGNFNTCVATDSDACRARTPCRELECRLACAEMKI